MNLRHIDLYAGIGGFTLACEWNGIETILFVEKDRYCQKVLRKHYPKIPIVEDIRDVKKIKEVVANCNPAGQPNRDEEYRGQQTQKGKGQYSSSGYGIGINSTGSKTATTNQPAILVTAGFPCQPFSVAGKRRGKADDRYLWPETLAVIKAIKPEWVLLENVAGIVGMVEQYRNFRVEGRSVIRTEEEDIFKGLYTQQEIMLLNTLRKDLEGEGFETLWLIIPACAVNAPHRRDRVWIVGNSTKLHKYASHDKRATGKAQVPKSGNTGSQTDVSDSEQSTSRRGGVFRDTRNERRGIPEAGAKGIQPRDRTARSDNSEQSSQDVANSIIGTKRSTHGQGSDKGRADDKQDNRDSLGNDIGDSNQVIPNTKQQGWQGQRRENGLRESCRTQETSRSDWWAVEPELGRVAHGIPHRVDRLKCLGNAVVPQVCYQIIKIIAEIENANNSLQVQH